MPQSSRFDEDDWADNPDSQDPDGFTLPEEEEHEIERFTADVLGDLDDDFYPELDMDDPDFLGIGDEYGYDEDEWDGYPEDMDPNFLTEHPWGPPNQLTPLRIVENNRPIFHDHQVTSLGKVVPGMVVIEHNFDGSTQKRIILTTPEVDERGFTNVWVYIPEGRGSIWYVCPADSSVCLSRGVGWNYWHFWEDTGERISPDELETLNARRKAER